MTLPSDVMERILVNVSNNAPIPEDETPDEKEFREKMESTLDRINGPDVIVEVPFEMPEVVITGERKTGQEVPIEEMLEWRVDGPW